MDSGSTAAAASSAAAAPLLTRSHEPLEEEIKDLKMRISKMEKQHSRDVNALNQEVSEMEALVEAKIFREADLEAQLADLKKALGAAKQGHSLPIASSSNGTERSEKSTIRPMSRTSSSRHVRSASSAYSQASSDATSSNRYSRDMLSESGEGRCEMCGDEHDMDDCPIFAGSSVSPTQPKRSSDAAAMKSGGHAGSGSGVWCEDCESDEHDLRYVWLCTFYSR